MKDMFACGGTFAKKINYDTNAELQNKLNSGTQLVGTYTVTIDEGRFVFANNTAATDGYAIIYSDDEVYDRTTFNGAPNFVAETTRDCFTRSPVPQS